MDVPGGTAHISGEGQNADQPLSQNVTQPDGKETAEFKEFYRFLMECFMEADQDRDGKVNLTEFDQMVEKAAAYPRSHGLAPPSSELYKTDADRIAARKTLRSQGHSWAGLHQLRAVA